MSEAEHIGQQQPVDLVKDVVQEVIAEKIVLPGLWFGKDGADQGAGMLFPGIVGVDSLDMVFLADFSKGDKGVLRLKGDIYTIEMTYESVSKFTVSVINETGEVEPGHSMRLSHGDPVDVDMVNLAIILSVMKKGELLISRFNLGEDSYLFTSIDTGREGDEMEVGV